MEHYLFRQLAFVRNGTLKAASGVSEEMADLIPDGFRNSIRWNLGHVYVVLERFAFHNIGLPQQLPDGFKERFEYGTSPLTSVSSAAVPSLPELERLLGEQNARIQAALKDRLQEKITPYTTSTGITLDSPEQFLSMALYHEGLHQSIIKLYKNLLTR
ncbi:DinB family protein [Paenibacillus sp. 1011MAR3C5]|uniref:DinB family protein n=1 Tax=Paenibacillus sp. 1011MAR3C5 TaxID=1675787 RepID=UPI000E6B9660|nr:DinB family protein [Paenibacillus sp. 1011MAR3C5]RJE85121.1 DinB family protein [Paenibacillus sp. 1011MAR3C5]